MKLPMIKNLKAIFPSKEIEEHCQPMWTNITPILLGMNSSRGWWPRGSARHVGKEAMEKMSFEEKFEKEEPFELNMK